MSFDKTAIEEANKHLLAMNKRVIELGAMLNDKTVRLENIEMENQNHVEAITRQKDAEIERKSAWLESSQAEIQRMKLEMTQKDREIHHLRMKASVLDKVIRYKPELIALLNCLNELDSESDYSHQTIQAVPTQGRHVFCEQMGSIGPEVGINASHEKMIFNDKHSEAPTNGMQSGAPSENDSAPAIKTVTHKAVVWTPKAIPPEQGDNAQNVTGNSHRPNILTKTPGRAVQNECSVSEPEDAPEQDQSASSDPDNFETHLLNYETQL